MPRLAAFMLLAVFAAACGADAPPKLPGTLSASALPEAAKSAFDDKWHGTWKIADVDPQATSCAPGGPPPTALLTSDFDSDGLSDLAAAVAAPDGVHLVVLLDRSGSYEVFDLALIGDKTANVTLGLAKRGTKLLKGDSKFDDFYPADTLTISSCGKQTIAYFWSGLGFYPVIPGATAAPTVSAPAPRQPASARR